MSDAAPAPSFFATKAKTAKRSKSKALPAFLTVAEVAQLMDLSEALVVARLKAKGFFPGAWQDGEEWIIPERAVRFCLRCGIQQLYKVSTVAAILDKSYDDTLKLTAAVTSIDAPLPPGKAFRALLFFFREDQAATKRIPESELLRYYKAAGMMGGNCS